MFTTSAADRADQLQSTAIQACNVKWGEDSLARSGRETLGIAVCKKKYTPFCFPVTTKQCSDGASVKHVGVIRMFGCAVHHPQRLQSIQKHGLRKGWQDFGQWSLRKAQELAKEESKRLNEDKLSLPSDDAESDDDMSSLAETSVSSFSTSSSSSPLSRTSIKTTPTTFANANYMCRNGNCAWKIQSAFDDVAEEVSEGISNAKQQSAASEGPSERES